MTTLEALLRERDAGLTAPFWTATAANTLVRPVCNDCNRSHFTPQWSCPHCHSENWEYVTSTGRGRVYSSTVVHRGPDESWATPYVLAIVDLDEGWSMLSRLLLDDATQPDEQSFAGRTVRVSFVPEDRDPHRVLPVFELAGTAKST